MTVIDQYNSVAALINNYICTHQTAKAESALKQLKEVCPEHESYYSFDKNKPCDSFGKFWSGKETLDGKTLEIFCDHGVGDTIMMLRYIKALKDTYDVKIVLNSLFWAPLKQLMEGLDFVDVFTRHHKECDYHTNIMMLPKIHHGHFEWSWIAQCPIPDQPLLTTNSETFCDIKDIEFGLKCNSAQSDLFSKKSIPEEKFIDFNYTSLEPNEEWSETVVVGDIADLMAVMQKLPVIVSVDTMTLHLAGSMGLPTVGLLCASHDERWGEIVCPVKSAWYPSVTLIKQKEIGEWDEVVECLSYFLSENNCPK